MTTASNTDALERLRAVVDEVQHVGFDTMAAAEQLRYVRMLEVARRRLEHGLEERCFRPVRDPDGTWTIYRPGGGGITPAA